MMFLSHRKWKDETLIDGERTHPFMFLTIEASQSIQSLEKEILILNYWSLLSSIGGFFGLLLGYSMLTFVQIAAEQCERVFIVFLTSIKRAVVIL